MSDLNRTNSISLISSNSAELETLCKHIKLIPDFDEAAAKSMSATLIRVKWPRAYGECPDCGERVIVYASSAHYYMGDW